MKISYKKIIPFLLGAGMLSGCGTSRNVWLVKYVTTAKNNDKIIIENVDGIPTQRVITFDNSDSVFYRSINVGDTIGCKYGFDDTQLIINVRNANIRLISRPDIMRAYYLQQQIVSRDSIIRNFNKTK